MLQYSHLNHSIICSQLIFCISGIEKVLTFVYFQFMHCALNIQGKLNALQAFQLGIIVNQSLQSALFIKSFHLPFSFLSATFNIYLGQFIVFLPIGFLKATTQYFLPVIYQRAIHSIIKKSLFAYFASFSSIIHQVGYNSYFQALPVISISAI